MEKLVALSGIKDIDFVHASGFIGGAISKESVILMGEMSLWWNFITLKIDTLFILDNE